MKVGVNCGHTICGAGNGAVGFIKESVHTRLVGYALMEKLKSAGIIVTDCTIDMAETQSVYLAEVVELANQENLDWFVSIHFNASPSHAGHGVEVYTYEGRQYPEAVAVCKNIEALGFRNRGVKAGNGLYVVRKTKAKAMLIEVCFCDNLADVDRYQQAGGENTIAQAIAESLYRDSFDEYVGRIAKKDWEERRIMLPSVVVAQAIKESAWGTSELAVKANALFGIKQNGWSGNTYIKAATEQRPDGSYYTIEETVWRAYENWEQSIIDHNDYIATRSTDGGKSLRYKPVIGCSQYILACQYLQECGYATSHSYGDSLIRDYIEKYNLTRFD